MRRLTEGAHGQNGSFKYIVEMPDGSLVVYDDRFKLEVVAYSTQYVDDDGVIEPGELGVVT
jgi:hypothetical protein